MIGKGNRIESESRKRSRQGEWKTDSDVVGSKYVDGSPSRTNSDVVAVA
jgi:hypothetical protein